MDSLRYWVLEMHVDGFRFDLAAALAREFHSVDRLAAFFDLVNQDPVVSQVKLIAEPWDVGEGGYQVGGFPALWTEWNGKYRDTVRDFWRGEPAGLGEFASRFTGSSDLYEKDNRRPIASINFVTAHDGFTLHDLVSYNDKHNHANGEDNRDGESHNRSWNHGVEGPTEDGEVHALRERQKRNFIATLLLSQGVPMISHGDELGRTQHGNNNVYCQDNETSWVDWKAAREYSVLTEFTGEVAKLRARAPGVPAAPVLPGPADPGQQHRRHRLAAARRAADDRARLALRLRAHARRLPQRRGHPGTRPARARGSSTTRSCCCSTPTTTRRRSRCPARPTGGCGRSSWTPPTPCAPARRARSATPSRAGGCGSRRGRCWCCSAGSDGTPGRGSAGEGGAATARVAERGGDRPGQALRAGRRRRRRAARRRGRRAGRAPRSRGRARTAGRAPRPCTSRPSTSTCSGTPRDGGPAARAHGSAVRTGEQGEAAVEQIEGRARAGPRAGPRRAGRARPAGRRGRSAGPGPGRCRRSPPSGACGRGCSPARRSAGPRTSSERAAAASPTGPRSASWLASSASPARPRATHASFQPSSWPSWTAVFRPIPADRRRAVRGVADEEPGPGRGRSWRPRRPA